jgi:hypothetical protein
MQCTLAGCSRLLATRKHSSRPPPRQNGRILTLPMKFLLFLAYAFINTFGITQPTPEAARRAAIYIGVLLTLIVVGILSALAGIHFFFRG